MSSEGRETLAADRLLDVLDGVSVLMYVQDRDGRIVHANRAACELVGKPPEEVVGKLPSELFDPATVERWDEQNQEILRTGRPIDVEDGWDGRTHLTHKTPVFDSEGKAVGVIGISTDITDRKRAEDELRRSERHLSEAQQIAGVGSWHWESAAGRLTWSTELCHLFGLAPEDAPTDENALLLVHEDDRPRVFEAGRAALAGEAPLELDARIVRGDGEIRVLHCRGGVAMGPDGSMDRIDGTCVDVTDRRRAEERLAEAQRLAQIGSFDWDIARDEITWSREMFRIFGEDPETFVPTRAMFREKIVEEDYDVILEQVNRARERGGDFVAFARIRQPDGELRDVHFRGAMVTTPGSAGEHLHGICQDLTDVRRAEEARAEAVERFRSVFERAPIGMALVARDGRFTLANEAMGEILGRPGAELLKVGVGHVTHPEDMPATAEALRLMVEGELPEWNAEKRYVRPSGEIRWGALRTMLLYDAEGRPQHALALLRDVTEQRLAEYRRSALHGVARIMGSGAPLSEALPALVETVVRELDCESRGAVAARRGRRPARVRRGVAARQRSGAAAGRVRDGHRRPRGERHRHDRPARAHLPAAGARRRPRRLRGGARAAGRRVRRPQARRGAAAPPGAPRPADRPAQPRPVLRPARARDPAAAARARPARGPVPRLRRLQGRQRPLRPRRRRRGAPARRRPRRLRAAGRGHGRALRRRRARGALRARGRRGRRRPDRRADPRAAAHADRPPRRAAGAVGEHRDLRRADRGRDARRAAAHRRRGDVRGQGRGARAATSSRRTDGPYHFRTTPTAEGNAAMARLIRMDSTGHSTLAEWTAGDAEAEERAVAEFRRQLDAGYYAMVTEGEGHARQVAELPLDAELVILRRPIAGG